MSGGTACKCDESRKPIKQRSWFVTQYRCNHSAFNGNRYTPSDYSAVVCPTCHRTWRTKAAYVDELPEKRA